MRSIQVRGHARWLALLASGMLVASLGIQSVSAAKPVAPTFVDYAQCANGAPPTVSLACPDGWINGILQATNSHYSEDQVTPQRAEVNIPNGGGGTHSLTFTWQARKGSAQTHAYDSLATWNYTQTAADRCQNLAAALCPGGTATTKPIPDDPQVLAPFSAPSNGVTTSHMLPSSTQAECDAYATTIPSRCFEMYGGTITGVTVPVHDCVATGKCNDASVDDYASTTITYTATPGNVQLLFGGHLAVGSAGGARTWGLGNGASDISGGPYHIKWTASDGASIGNRDNQIMGSAIIFQDTTNTTQVELDSDNSSVADGAAVDLGTDVHDTDTLTGFTATAGGTVNYYYELQSGTLDCTIANGTLIGSAVTVTNGIVPDSASVSLDNAGTYEFWAVYSGDPNNGTSTSTCGSETVVVNAASNTISTAQELLPNDHATLGGLTSNAAGTINFKLFGPDNTTCDENGSVPLIDENVTVSGSGTYDTTNTTVTVSDDGTYNWLVVYTPDNGNNSGATSDCGVETFTIDNDSTAP
jgi:hypothetical protein